MKLPTYQPEAASTTRFLFFTGKGGVGKTSLSCATALKLVDAGKRVLLVSTDPASNLDEVLGTKLTNAPTPIPGAPGLDALNINPVEAAAAYRERLIGPMRNLLPEAALRSMEEQLSGSCTVEIAAFDEFSGLIGDPEAAKAYDHVVFDTAPTGHTLRLMSLAKAWDQFLDKNTSGTSCLGPLAGLEKQRGIYEATVNTLADAKATTLVLVSRPQLSALREAERTSQELRALGVANQCLVINGRFETECPEDVTAQAMQKRGEDAMQAAQALISSMPSFIVPLCSINILGIGGLRALLDDTAEASAVPTGSADWNPPAMQSLADLVTGIEKQGHGVIMTMGKGGVGKTTVAAAIAVLLAKRGHSVHLSTTDPAAHIAQTLAVQLEGSIPPPKPPPTPPKSWPIKARRWMPQVVPFSKRIFGPPARRKSPCFALSPAKSARARNASSCSTPRPPATRCSCWMPARPTTANSNDRPAARSPRKCSGSSITCAIPPSRTSFSSPCPRPRPCMRPPRYKTISAVPTSSPSRGSSIKACSKAAPATRCSDAASTPSIATSRKSSKNKPPTTPGFPGRPKNPSVLMRWRIWLPRTCSAQLGRPEVTSLQQHHRQSPQAEICPSARRTLSRHLHRAARSDNRRRA